MRCDGSSLTLRYFDFSSCFSIFAPKLDHLRCLEEVRIISSQYLQYLHSIYTVSTEYLQVRIGADAPPEFRQKSRKHRKDVRTPTEQVDIYLYKYLSLYI